MWRCGSVAWCGVMWCGVVWCGVVWCGVVWCGVVWCGVVWCGVVWCGVLCCAALHCYVPFHVFYCTVVYASMDNDECSDNIISSSPFSPNHPTPPHLTYHCYHQPPNLPLLSPPTPPPQV